MLGEDSSWAGLGSILSPPPPALPCGEDDAGRGMGQVEGAPPLVSSTRSVTHAPRLGPAQALGWGSPVSGCWRLLQARTSQARICPLHVAGSGTCVWSFSLFPDWLRLLCQRSGKRTREAQIWEASGPSAQLKRASWTKTAARERKRRGLGSGRCTPGSTGRVEKLPCHRARRCTPMACQGQQAVEPSEQVGRVACFLIGLL